MARLAELVGGRCFGCGRPGPALCRSCAGDLRPPSGPAEVGGVPILSAFAYEGAARELVLALKLRARRSAAAPLIDAMVAIARVKGAAPDAIAWVPGRSRDVRRRGYDHAHVLAV